MSLIEPQLSPNVTVILKGLRSHWSSEAKSPDSPASGVFFFYVTIRGDSLAFSGGCQIVYLLPTSKKSVLCVIKQISSRGCRPGQDVTPLVEQMATMTLYPIELNVMFLDKRDKLFP